jgi:hypothetical protein
MWTYDSVSKMCHLAPFTDFKNLTANSSSSFGMKPGVRQFVLWTGRAPEDDDDAPSSRRLLIVNWLRHANSMDIMRYLTAHGLQLPADVDVMFVSVDNAHTWCLHFPPCASVDLQLASLYMAYDALPAQYGGGYLVTNSECTIVWPRLLFGSSTSWVAGSEAVFFPKMTPELKEQVKILTELGVGFARAISVLLPNARRLDVEPFANERHPTSAVVTNTPIHDAQIRQWLLTQLGGDGWPLPLPGPALW